MGLIASIALRGGSAAARQLLQLEDRRTKQLQHLTSLVTANLGGEYKAGIEHLEIAAKADTNPQSAARHLGLAEERFVVAFGNFRDVEPLQAAWAALYLTIICIATERNDEALYWAQRAHRCAVRAADLVSQHLNDDADGRIGRVRVTSEKTQNAAVIGGAAAVGVTMFATGALLPVAVVFGGYVGVGKLLEMHRNRMLKVGAAKVEEMSAFVSDLMDLRSQLGDKEIQQ